MSISVIIPVWNDAAGAQSALNALAGASEISEMIFVDDHSDQELKTLLDTSHALKAGKSLQILRHDRNRGGGAARNTGLEAATQPFVIFLDSDDLPTQDYNDILGEFIEFDRDFDFAMFRHSDSREESKGIYQGLPIDEERWKKLTKGPGPQVMSDHEHAMMASVSAYPWNKLYRTEFLRQNNILCTEIPVHNDIEIHWVGFICANKILYSHRVGVKHFVSTTGHRITNRKGEERLRVFIALQNVVQRLADHGSSEEMHNAYWTFFANLMNWVPANLENDFKGQLQSQRREFIFLNLPKSEYRKMAWRDSALTSRLLKLVQRSD